MTGGERGSNGGYRWDEEPALSEPDFDRDYARLLERGITSCGSHRYMKSGLRSDELNAAAPASTRSGSVRIYCFKHQRGVHAVPATD